MPSGVEVQVLSRAPVLLQLLAHSGYFILILFWLCYTSGMSKIGDYLNQRLSGDVLSDIGARERYSTDGSVLNITPRLVVLPRTLDDVRKVARFAWRLAERGQFLSLTARGAGTDPTGAAITDGIILSMQNYMNHIMELDTKSKLVRVQAGIKLMTLREAMATHGLKLLADDGVITDCTIGGMLSSNTITDSYIKYGDMLNCVDCVEVVLANGEVIQTGKLTKRELSAKKGLETMEGDLYRFVDSLIEDNPETIDAISAGRALDSTVYALDRVKDKDGNFDLTPLFIGSQGTLGIITQAILKLDDLSEEQSMIAAAITEDQNESDLFDRLSQLVPSAFTFIDGDTLKLITETTGYEPWKLVTKNIPKLLIFMSFDGKYQAKQLRKAGKVLDSAGVVDAKVAVSADDRMELAALRDSTYIVNNYSDDGSAAVHLVDSLAVVPEHFVDLIDRIHIILDNNHVKAGVWGNLGAGTITVRPLLNLSSIGHRQLVFRLLKEFSQTTFELDGDIAGCGGIGRLLTPYARKEQHKEVVDMMDKLRKEFDPFRILNRDVCGDIDPHKLVEYLRNSYSTPRGDSYNMRS